MESARTPDTIMYELRMLCVRTNQIGFYFLAMLPNGQSCNVTALLDLTNIDEIPELPCKLDTQQLRDQHMQHNIGVVRIKERVFTPMLQLLMAQLLKTRKKP